MADIFSSRLTPIGRVLPVRAVRPPSALIVICCLGLALGACSKCDVPNLLPHQAAPQMCHDGPSPS
jgi:hypothetical protein